MLGDVLPRVQDEEKHVPPPKSARRNLGSARVSRAGFGVSPKQSFLKVRESGTPSPTRETRALPGQNRRELLQDFGSYRIRQ